MEEETQKEREPMISIVFDSRYKGHVKDMILEKLRMFFSMIFLAILMLLIALYAAYSLGGNVPLGIILYFGSGIVLVSAFIIPLFRRRNSGMTGQIEIDFYPESLEYEVRGTRKKKPFQERAKLVQIKIRKKTVLIVNTKAGYLIPMSAITREQLEALRGLKSKLNKPKPEQKPSEPDEKTSDS